MATILKPLLKTEDVSRILKVPNRTVTRLAKKKAIPGAKKIGGNWRFDRDHFGRWLASRRKIRLQNVVE